MKKANRLILIFLLFLPCILTSCKNDSESTDASEREKIYELAKDAGYEGTYEEWTNTVRGNSGEDGKSVTNVIKEETNFDSLKEIYTFVYSDGSTSSIEIPLIKGNKGETGDKGDTGDKGQVGNTGKDGINGLDGEKGPQGEKGENGDVGNDGKVGYTPYIGENDDWWINKTDTNIKATGQDAKPAPKIDKINLVKETPYLYIYELIYDNDISITFTCSKFKQYDDTQIYGKWILKNFDYDIYLFEDNTGEIVNDNLNIIEFDYTIDGNYLTINYDNVNVSYLPDVFYVFKHDGKYISLSDGSYALLTREYQDCTFKFASETTYTSYSDIGTYIFTTHTFGDKEPTLQCFELLNTDESKVFEVNYDKKYLIKNEICVMDGYIDLAGNIHRNYKLPTHLTPFAVDTEINDIFISNDLAVVNFKSMSKVLGDLSIIENNIYKIDFDDCYLTFSIDKKLCKFIVIDYKILHDCINKLTIFDKSFNRVIKVYKDNPLTYDYHFVMLENNITVFETIFNLNDIYFSRNMVEIHSTDSLISYKREDKQLRVQNDGIDMNCFLDNVDVNISSMFCKNLENIYEIRENEKNIIYVNNIPYECTIKYENETLTYDIKDESVKDLVINLFYDTFIFTNNNGENSIFDNFKNFDKTLYGNNSDYRRKSLLELKFDDTGTNILKLKYSIIYEGFEEYVPNKVIFETNTIIPIVEKTESEIIIYRCLINDDTYEIKVLPYYNFNCLEFSITKNGYTIDTFRIEVGNKI